MKIEQRSWSEQGEAQGSGSCSESAALVLAFGARVRLEQPSLWAELRGRWPGARVVGCSTAGEISGTRVRDGSLVATALAFERAQIACAQVQLAEVRDSQAAGAALSARLDPKGLRHVLVLSDGLRVNGSELVRGITEALPGSVSVTGGLSADGGEFGRTCIALDRFEPGERVVAIGFYGEGLEIGFGSGGGWDPFGPERVVTRSRGAVVYEFDGEPALRLYRRYLGDEAAQLPASGLRFPLAIRDGAGRAVVRTILAIDEREQSLTFAGDVPEGVLGRLMHANFDRLVEGAAGAARICRELVGGAAPELALLISCVGRKLVLQQRVEEEVEAVQEVLGTGVALTGFYSHGELCPAGADAQCALHNQTMTITTLREA
jgi:hypothetical protein